MPGDATRAVAIGDRVVVPLLGLKKSEGRWGAGVVALEYQDGTFMVELDGGGRVDRLPEDCRRVAAEGGGS